MFITVRRVIVSGDGKTDIRGRIDLACPEVNIAGHVQRAVAGDVAAIGNEARVADVLEG